MAAGTEITTRSVQVLHESCCKDSQQATSKRRNDAGNSDLEAQETRLETGMESGGVGRPPLPSAPTVRRCITGAHFSSACQPDVVEVNAKVFDIINSRCGMELDFVPIIRSGGCAHIGCRHNMEDMHVMVDDLFGQFAFHSALQGPCAYFGVFDGHSGRYAAEFVSKNLLRYILEDVAFPLAMEEAVRKAFLRTDKAFAEACLVDEQLCSGTTAIAALVLGRTLLVANAGDCRAVLSKRGKAVDMSRDHKACCVVEKKRVEASGGFVDKYGYLNGELTVARALGDWHIEGLKESGIDGPLSAVPEMQRINLTEEDEFLIIGCDGIWDVFSSQNAVDFARRQLQRENDPRCCCKALIDEALRRDASDNVTVVMVCFQEVPPPHLAVSNLSVRRSISAEGLRSLTTALQQVIEEGALEGILRD